MRFSIKNKSVKNKKKTIKKQITKEMSLTEVIQKYPKTLEVFASYGLHCIGCTAASFENLEMAAVAHNINLDKLLKDLNKVI